MEPTYMHQPIVYDSRPNCKGYVGHIFMIVYI